MDIVGNGLDTVGELILVGNQPAVFVTLLFAPAVVDNDILVACVFQSAFNEKSAVVFISSSLIFQPKVFQEFQPMGGVCARGVFIISSFR